DPTYQQAYGIELFCRFFKHALLYPVNFLLAGKLPCYVGPHSSNFVQYSQEAKEIVCNLQTAGENDPYLLQDPPRSLF
ncbi:MAG: hypothetical protein KDD62_10710, partial [Bdellovibrionales bacterium]|nr:hypothetical protein [Bdellovibrionales bacterium]